MAIIMKYRGHIIEAEYGHYKVTSPHGAIWRTDTVTEAKREIEEMEDGEEVDKKEVQG